MPRQSILQVRNLRLERENIIILDGINWCIQKGQHWAILGPNGSGKTTLLSTLTGYTAPTAGDIQLLGKTYGESHWPELRKKIGIVSSTLNKLMPHDEPALETIISGKYAMIDLWQKPTANDKRQARTILKKIECTALANQPWLFLSQGERQRILIGRALMARPKLLILDEPCAGLDPVAREHFLQFLDRLGHQRSAPALILVTHHVEEITPAFTHALLLKQGRVSAGGPIGETLNSRSLTDSFESPLRLRRSSNRYNLSVCLSQKKMM
ncbi:MAG: ABC transporter [Verrucomicrobiales bacterium]|nr:ABC transporter [Verrucomicrobiales bacterium]